MTCVKTGADILLEPHSCVIHGDLFQIGTTFILKTTPAALDALKLEETRANMCVWSYEACGQDVYAWTEDECSELFYHGHDFVLPETDGDA